MTGNKYAFIEEFKFQMHEMFEMTDMGEMAYFFGIEIHQDHQVIFIGQEKYATEIFNKFYMKNCKPISTALAQNEKLFKEDGAKKVDASVYRSLIGCLLYLIATGLDIMYAASLLSRFIQSPNELDFKTAKRVLRYVEGPKDLGIWFKKNGSSRLIGYTDSDSAGSCDDMKSTFGYVFLFGISVFGWNSKKPETMVQSTAEAEYIAAAATINLAIWLRKFLRLNAKSK